MTNSLIRSDIFVDTKNFELTPKQAQRVIDLGFSMKLLLMQPDAIKLAEEMIKIIRKMNINTFFYRQRTLGFIQKMKESCISSLYQPSQLSYKKPSQKDIKSDNLPQNRQLLIQKIVQQLSNAKQDVAKIKQLDNNLQISAIDESQADQGITSINLGRRQSDSQNQELKKAIMKFQNDCKMYKKTIQQLTKASDEKQQKINTMKSKILKLNEFIMKQAKNPNQNDQKISQSTVLQSQNQNSAKQDNQNLANSEALQRQVVHLKKQVQQLKKSLTQSYQSAPKKNLAEANKQKQFLELSRQYNVVKQEVNSLISLKKRTRQTQEGFSGQQQEQIMDNNDKQNPLATQAQLQIYKQRYKFLQSQYLILQKQKQQMTKSISRGQIQSSQSHNYLEFQKSPTLQSKQTRKSRNSQKLGKTSQLRRSQIGSDQQQIIRQIKQIDKMQKMSQISGINSFESILNPAQLNSKIQGFDYNNSVIYKVKSSKFIQTFEAKLTLVLQYTCLLQLYFSKTFRSTMRQELMMEDSITLRPITPADLNQALFMDVSQINQGSFTANMNSSKISYASVPNRNSADHQQIPGNQINKTTPVPKNRQQKIIDSLVSSSHSAKQPEKKSSNNNQRKQQTRKRLQQIEAEFKQIIHLIPNNFLNPHQLRQDEQFMQRVIKLRENSIAQIISNVLKQNQVFKKCLNQMIKNQQNFTKINNEIYFDEDGQLRRKPNPMTDIKSKIQMHENRGKDKDKDNCSIM